MNKEKYILSLRQGLGQSEQSKRFIEELKDHIDDACMDPLKPRTEEEATINAGNPHDVAKRFNGYLSARLAGRALAHSLMNVLLSVPLYVIAVWGLLMLVDTLWNSINHPTILIQSVVALLISAALLFLLFHKSIPDVFLAIPGWRPHLLWLVIMFGPQLLIAWNSPATFEGLDPEGTATVPGYILFSVLASQLGLFLFTTATFVLSVKRARNIRRIKTRRKWRMSTFAPALILLAYVCISQILVIAQETNSYPAVFNRVPRDILHSFLFPRGIVEFIVFNNTACANRAFPIWSIPSVLDYWGWVDLPCGY